MKKTKIIISKDVIKQYESIIYYYESITKRMIKEQKTLISILKKHKINP